MLNHTQQLEKDAVERDTRRLGAYDDNSWRNGARGWFAMGQQPVERPMNTPEKIDVPILTCDRCHKPFTGTFAWSWLNDTGAITTQEVICDNCYKQIMATPPPQGIDLDELEHEARYLVGLLENRQPGLMMWNEMLKQRLETIRDIANRGLSTPPKK